MAQSFILSNKPKKHISTHKSLLQTTHHMALTRMSNASFQFRVQLELITISINEFC
jgi:hypothetical protein